MIFFLNSHHEEIEWQIGEWERRFFSEMGVGPCEGNFGTMLFIASTEHGGG